MALINNQILETILNHKVLVEATCVFLSFCHTITDWVYSIFEPEVFCSK